jgi:eukaryotic-like serine/threonine-protein kinase
MEKRWPSWKFAQGLRVSSFFDVRHGTVTPFLNSGFNEDSPRFSPDGRWIAYVSNESGRSEVYVQSFGGPRGRVPISGGGGTQPLWAPVKKQLFYRKQGGTEVWAVDYRADGEFPATSKPYLLFRLTSPSGIAPISTWDISPDGRRFLMAMNETAKPSPATEMILVQNWFEELKAKVSVKR